MGKNNTNTLPKHQYAVQLIGPDKLVLNKSKEVFRPDDYQILCKVEAVGLCFSDLKLLKQFSSHPRKGNVLSGIDTDILEKIPCYVPGDLPTVPGHEAVIRIEAVGPNVEQYKAGERYLVQTDYRWLSTANSNAAFGYNFEGGLQEYVLMDERIITSPKGDSMLIPVSEKLSASAVALIEPWACVEDAYASRERKKIKAVGNMLIVADIQLSEDTFQELFNRYDKPARIIWLSRFKPPAGIEGVIEQKAGISDISDNSCDDIIYFGSNAATAEELFSKLAAQGLINFVLCDGSFSRDIKTPVGRIHYSNIRIIGTTGTNPAWSLEYIPETGEIRADDKINIIGAAGPMGLMHVIRNICHDIEGQSVYGSDIDDTRLARLTEIASIQAEKYNVEYKSYNSKKEKISISFDYSVLMIPVPALIPGLIQSSAENGIINIFAGIPASVFSDIDLNSYIKKQLYFIGTSGSTIEDMKIVLEKVEAGRLDTNTSTAAICGLDGAIEGIRAVESRSVAGKIIVYPTCKGLGLTKLEELSDAMPEVDKYLHNGFWSGQAEEKLLELYKQ